MEYAVECSGLEKRYDDFTLGPIDLNIDQGMVAGLVGTNGAGKTTLIKLLLGLTLPDAGTFSLLGQPVENPANLSAAIKARIGFVPDTCAFTQASRVADVAQLGRAAYRNWDGALFTELTNAFGLQPKKQVQKLSRGMGMKLSIAFALAHHPELLILDEATAGLDPLARDEILDILRDYMLDETHTMLMSTHITSDLEKIADKIICIDEGKILFAEQKDVLCDEAGIAHVRGAQLDELLVEGVLSDGRVRIMRREYGADILVSDRFTFTRRHPDIPVDRATIDEYMNLMLKGEVPCEL